MGGTDLASCSVGRSDSCLARSITRWSADKPYGADCMVSRTHVVGIDGTRDSDDVDDVGDMVAPCGVKGFGEAVIETL